MLDLAPFTMVAVWMIFTFSKSVMVKLISLLMSSLALPVMFMDLYKLFWPCGLLLILMTTGLIVVFAYVVSLHEGSGSFNIKYSLLMLMMLLFMLNNKKSEFTSIKHLNSQITVDYLLTITLILILLFIVVNFVRLVYSKGGGFRKKF